VDTGGWTAKKVREVLTNPYHCILIDPRLAEPHELAVSEEQFIQAGVRLIQAIGPEKYPKMVLNNLKARGKEFT
jgi:hypothetical protein